MTGCSKQATLKPGELASFPPGLCLLALTPYKIDENLEGLTD